MATKKITSAALAEKLHTIMGTLDDVLFERTFAARMMVLTMMARENIWMLGLPGTAKSLLARLLAKMILGRYFYALTSELLDPELVLGPISPRRLMEDDVYEHSVEGFLPAAHIALLDELGKASDALHTALLPIVNPAERFFPNGETTVKCPIQLLISASNEMPKMEAFRDRFVVAVNVLPIQHEENFRSYLRAKVRVRSNANEEEKATSLKARIDAVEPVMTVRELQIARARMSLGKLSEDFEDVLVEIWREVARIGIYVSDRQYGAMVTLAQAAAFLDGDRTVKAHHAKDLWTCLWGNIEEIGTVRQIVATATRTGAASFHARATEIVEGVYATWRRAVVCAISPNAIESLPKAQIALRDLEEAASMAIERGVHESDWSQEFTSALHQTREFVDSQFDIGENEAD